MANFFSQFGSNETGVPGIGFTAPKYVDALPLSIKSQAAELGIDPVHLATAIGYETAGTYDKWKKGPTTKWGTHRGLIQWGEPQAAQYGVDANTPVDEQMVSVGRYLKDRGVQPGMGLEDIYSAINAGAPGMPNASDRPGKTVRTHVAAMDDFVPGAQELLGVTQQGGNFFAKFHNSQPSSGSGGRNAAQAAETPSAPTQPPMDTGRALLTDFLNQQTAASQGTTPITSAQAPNLVSDQAFYDELGDVNYRDPKTGAVIPTDKNKHVVLTDPLDNKVKVYARTAETDEGRLSAGGRILGTGVVGLPGGVAVRGIPKATAAAKALTGNQAVVEAGGRIGVDVPSYAVAKPVTQSIARKLSDIPFVGTPVESSAKSAVGQLGRAAKTAEGLFGSGDVPKAGDAARKSLTGYIRGVSAEGVTKAYDKVDDLIEFPALTRPLISTEKVATAIDRLRDASASSRSGAVAFVENALARKGGLTYEGIKGLRSEIGEMIDTGVLPANTSGKELKRIYGALTDDLKETIRMAGGDKALSAWERANRYTALISARRENLTRILGAPSDEGIVERLTATASSKARADIKLLAQARKAAGPEAWRELASAVISRMGRAQGGDFSPTRFFTAYDNLSARGRGILFRSTGNADLAQYIDDIATVSKRFKDIEQYANTSRTGATNAITATAAGVGSAITGILAGSIMAPLSVLGPIVGGRVLAHLLSKPASAKVLRDWVRAYELAARSKSLTSVNAYVSASKVLAVAIASEARTPNLLPRLSQEIQGAGPTQAQPDNRQ
jgi:hypothetical protein